MIRNERIKGIERASGESAAWRHDFAFFKRIHQGLRRQDQAESANRGQNQAWVSLRQQGLPNKVKAGVLEWSSQRNRSGGPGSDGPGAGKRPRFAMPAPARDGSASLCNTDEVALIGHRISTKEQSPRLRPEEGQRESGQSAMTGPARPRNHWHSPRNQHDGSRSVHGGEGSFTWRSKFGTAAEVHRSVTK